MKYYMFSKTIKGLPRLRWLNVFVPSPVKEWLTASDKSFAPFVNNTQQYSDKQKHPAESRIVRVVDITPRP
ncbi:MAG: hypothetical protein H7122_13235 [Chitinophagaceae bacterium]|nr:hypothetical protein [Chitinophagaceae bacterium]